MEKENKQYPDQEFIKQLQDGLAEDINKIFKDAVEQAKRISSGQEYPDPVVFKSDKSADPDQFKEQWESNSSCECRKTPFQKAADEHNRKSDDIRDLLDQQQVTVGKFKLKPCEAIIRTGNGKVIHSVCLDDSLKILNAEKARSESAMDKELSTGDQAVEKLGTVIEKSKELSDNVDEQFGKREQVTPVFKRDPYAEAREEAANKAKRTSVEQAKEAIVKINELKRAGEWLGQETASIKLPDEDKVKIHVSQEVRSQLSEPVCLMAQKELVPPKRKDNEKYQDEIVEQLKTFRDLRGDDQWDNPAGKFKENLAQIMKGETHEDEFISDDTLDPCKPTSYYFDKNDEQIWKERKFKEYTNEMFRIFHAKNQDYTAADSIGSAFDVTYDLFGPIAPAVRFMDKVLRYVSLTSGKEQKVADEKVEDTLMDLANYALLTRLKIEKDEKQKA